VNKVIHRLRKNFDEAAILTALLGSKLRPSWNFPDDDESLVVLAAFRRANPAFENASLLEIQEYLLSLSEAQIRGILSNTKGALHEAGFVRQENEDGDSTFAAIFGDPMHPDVDVVSRNSVTGEETFIQLKATDSKAIVQDWIDRGVDGKIAVTSELAEAMSINSSGISNEELTAQTEEFLDAVVSASPTSSIWQYVPLIGIASIGAALIGLHKRWRAGGIPEGKFLNVAAKMTGIKAAKIGAIAGLLSIPGIGQITTVALIVKMMIPRKA